MFVPSPEQTQLTLTQTSAQMSIPDDFVSSQVTVLSEDVPFSQMTDMEAEFETSFVELSLQDQERKDESSDFAEMAPGKVSRGSGNLDLDAGLRLSGGKDCYWLIYSKTTKVVG